MNFENKDLLAPGRFASVDEALGVLNRELLKRAKSKGVRLGPISIEGVRAGTDAQKIREIQTQFKGLMERLTIPPRRLGKG